MTDFELVLTIVMWTLASLPAVRVVINVALGRKRWRDHDEFSAAFSLTALLIGLFVLVSVVITTAIMEVL